MNFVRLGDVCTFTSGGTPSRSVESYFQGEIPWITGADISGPVAYAARSYISSEALAKSAASVATEGTVLLVTRTSVGKVAVAGRDIAFSQDITAVQPHSAVTCASYITQMLRIHQPTLERQARGATIKGVTRQAVESLEIPLPPLDEQRRIAAILDKADQLRTKRREALAHLDALTQSIFRSMFDKPAGGSTEVRLDDLCEVSSGITKGRRTSATDLTTLPYVAVSNVQDRALNMSVVKEIAVTWPEAERYRLKRGDLLLTEGGDPDKLGRGTIWNDELPWCLHQNHVFRVRPKEDVVPMYLNWYLASREVKSYFLRMAKQTTGIASINKTQLSAAPVKLPPLRLQQTFATRVAAVERLKELHRKHLAELDTLFASLQHRAFKGEL